MSESKYRIHIVGDMDPTEPYDDGSSPLFRLDYRYGWHVEQVAETTSYRVDDALIDSIGTILNRHGFEVLAEPLWDRYLAVWFGVTASEWWHSGDAWYLTCDPADWREKVGAAEGSISMAEWQAHCTGDVYGVIPETLVPWTATDGRVNEVWEDTTGEGCWGFYGRDNALAYASEMFPGVEVYED